MTGVARYFPVIGFQKQGVNIGPLVRLGPSRKVGSTFARGLRGGAKPWPNLLYFLG